MTEESKLRSMRVSDLIADGIEEEANRLPPSEKNNAEYLRKTAKIIREREDSRIIRIVEGSYNWEL